MSFFVDKVSGMPINPADLANAQFEFVQALAEFQAKNPSATPSEVGDFARERAAGLAKRHGPETAIPTETPRPFTKAETAGPTAAETAKTLAGALADTFGLQQQQGTEAIPAATGRPLSKPSRS